MNANTTPRMRFGTKSKEPLAGAAVAIRLAALVFAVTNPVAAVVAAGAFLALRRWRRVRPLLVLLAGVGLLALMLLRFTQGPRYVLWVLDLGPVIADAAATLDAGSVPAAAGALFAERWGAWLVAQVPVGIALGIIVGAALAMYLRRYDAPWRQPTKHRKVLSRRKAVRRAERMDGWAQKPPKVRAAAGGDEPRKARAVKPLTVADVKIRLGVDQETGRPADLPLAAFLKHCWIDGASGFGKTTDIIALVRGALEAPAAQPLRIPLVYLNLKPDPEVTESMRRIAYRAGRTFRHVTLGGATAYNPIRHGNAAEVATRIIEVEEAAQDGGFSEPFHKANGQELLGYATRALDELVAAGRHYERGKVRVPWQRDLHHLHRIMRLKTLMDNRHHLSGDLQLDLVEYKEELDEIPRKKESAEGMRARIGKMLTSAIGDTVREQPDGLNLEDAILAGDVVVFDLDSMQDTVAATSLANLTIKDMQAVLGHIGSKQWNRTAGEVTRMGLIVVDEFSALGGDAVTDLIQRGRTNGGAVVLATQDVGSVLDTSEGLLTTILTNTNVQMVHVQSERAEDYAKSWGTQTAMAETMQVYDDRTIIGTLTSKSGQGSLREVKEFVIHPDTLRTLAPGEIILATRDPWQQRRVLVQRRLPAPLTDEEVAAAEGRDEEQSEPDAADTEPPADTGHADPEEMPAPSGGGPSGDDPAGPSGRPDEDTFGEEPDTWETDDFDLFDHDTEETR